MSKRKQSGALAVVRDNIAKGSAHLLEENEQLREELRQERARHEALIEKVKKLFPRMFDPKAPRY